MSHDISVPRWLPGDFAFRSSGQHKNPFDVRFAATVRGPGGIDFDALGFYDGGKTGPVALHRRKP